MFVFQGLDVETDGPETVVATDHGGIGIFHPAVIKIAAA